MSTLAANAAVASAGAVRRARPRSWPRSRPRQKQAGAPEAQPGRGLHDQGIVVICQALSGSGQHGGQRRIAVLCRRDRCRLHPSADGDGRWSRGGAAGLRRRQLWDNTALGNIKAAIVGTYRSVNSKHVPRTLAEFQYRFNRRYDLAAMLPRLCWASTRTPPIPYRLLKLAEVYA